MRFFDWLTDNRLAIILLAAIAGALIMHEAPTGSGQILGPLVGGLIGFLTGATKRQSNNEPPTP